MASEIKLVKPNVYQKLQKVRAQLVALDLKQTGKNTYSNYTYFELGDFLPALNKLMDEAGLMTRFVIQGWSTNHPEKAVLEIFNTESPEDKVTFYSETANVEIGTKKDGSGGATAIQNLGGKITYMRRYLLMVAFEIIESDAVNREKTEEKQKQIDSIEIDRINDAETYEELVKICAAIKKEVGQGYHKSIVVEYTRRKKELEAQEKLEKQKTAEAEVPEFPETEANGSK